MAGDILGISTSGTLAAQRALATTGHNIANANTEGYSVQRVELDARPPQLAANGAIGSGVTVSNVRRMFDDFVTKEVEENTATGNSLDISYRYTSQVDNLLADPNVGLAPALQSFFSSVNGVADDPQSTAARQVMVSEAKSLSQRFAYMDDRLGSIRRGVNEDLRVNVNQLNELAKGVATLNDTIIKAREVGGNTPNDLLDQRDRLILQISEKVAVRTKVQEDGRMNVFIGNGQALVVGSAASQLETVASRFDPDEVELVFKGHGSESIVTGFISGGLIGGILEFRNGILNSTQNQLGRIAIGIAKTFNAQHRRGMDLENRLGGLFFSEAGKLAPKVLPHYSNTGNKIVRAEITNTDKLTTSDYTLSFNNGKYRLVRSSDNKVLGDFSSLPIEVESEGFRLSFDEGGSIQNGDRFIIRPTRAGSENFLINIGDVKRIAAASPLRTEAAISNLGTGKISVAEVVDVDNPIFDRENNNLRPPFVLRFRDDTHFEVLDNSGSTIQFNLAAVPDSPNIVADEEGNAQAASKPGAPSASSVTSVLEYDPLNGTDVFPTPSGEDFGFRVRITGEPRAGDEFKIEFNTDGTGDNRNAVMLAALQETPTLENGTTDYAQAYSQLVSKVGSKTHELEINGKAQQLLLEQARERKESISGVNLDEEAANLIRFQNLYQANAQVISVANKLLETLMNAFR